MNGKQYPYKYNNFNIEFNNINCYNNQFIEVHLKYKYYSNEEKYLYRQESVSIRDTKNTYCKVFVKIPDNYIILSTNEIFKNNPEIKNNYFYNAICNYDEILETFKLCFETAIWK